MVFVDVKYHDYLLTTAYMGDTPSVQLRNATTTCQVRVHGRATRSPPLTMSLVVVPVDVKYHDYLLTTAYMGDTPSVQLRNATTTCQVRVHGRATRSPPLTMSLVVVPVDVKYQDYLLTTAYMGDPPSVQLRKATTTTCRVRAHGHASHLYPIHPFNNESCGGSCGRKAQDYLLTTARTGDPLCVQLRNAATTTYQKNISCLILDGEVWPQDVEVKGGRQQTAVTAPLLPLAQQESVANPRLNQVVDSVCLGFCGETDASLCMLRQQRRFV